MVEPEYLIYRKKYVFVIWLITYIYNIIIAIFFYHPEIVEMNFDNIDNRILKICRTFCLFDIILTPLFIIIIKCITYNLFKDLRNGIFNSLEEVQKISDEAEIRRRMKEFEKKNKVSSNYGMFGQALGNMYSTFGAMAIASDITTRREQRNREIKLRLEIKKKNYRYNYLKTTLFLMPHGSFQWYSLITSIYSTIVFVINFTTKGYILWSIYFILLILNIISIHFSVYLNFFKTNKFVILLIQLFDLGSNFAFLYRIGGITSKSKKIYGKKLLVFYLISFLISYFLLLLLYYYDFMEKRIPDNGEEKNKKKIKKYQKKQLYSNTSLGIFGNIPLSIFTLVINNIESDGDNSITVISVVTSLLTFVLSISSLIESRQINYTYETTSSTRTSEI